MAAAPAGKMKRKDMDDVYNEFSDFSLSAPATKIRRLDAELPPIVEEEEPAPAPAPASAPAVPLTTTTTTTTTTVLDISMDGLEECMVPLHEEERALVLYKPMVNNNNQLILSPSSSLNVPYRVSSDIISGIKNQCFWRGNMSSTEEKTPVDDEQAANNCLAVVPWQAPVNAYAGLVTVAADGALEDMMDAEVAEAELMEVEEENIGEATSTGVGGEEFHQQPQHCMIPQILPNPSTPIMWS